MAKTLRLCLIEQTILPQLDFLLFALDSLRPAGDDLVIIDEVLVETRRVLADLRRVLAGMPLHISDPVAPVTRRKLRALLLEGVELMTLYKQEQRQRSVSRRKEARQNSHLQEKAESLSPRPFARIE